MHRKLLTALIVAPAIFVLPAIGNLEAILQPHLWILVFIGVMASVFQPEYRPVDESAPTHDHGTATQIVWSVYITQVAGVIEAAYFRYPQSMTWDAISILALAGAAVGFGLRTWAVHELGRFFTWHITVHSDHRVVDTGPYRIMRHPGYSGGLLIYLSTLFFIHAWVTAVVAIGVLIFAFKRRIQHEEAWLTKHLGKAYSQYAKSVKALIPYVW